MRSFVFLAAVGLVATACTGDPPSEATTSSTVIESTTAPTATSPPSTTVPGTLSAPPSWQQLAPVPTARTEVAVAVHNGLIYVVGGFDEAGRTVDTVEVYDIGSNTWIDGPPLLVGVNHAMAASVGGRLYVAGGYTDGLRDATDKVFELEDGGWIEVVSMPAVRAAGGAVGVGDKLYVVAGVGQSGIADRTFVYEPSARSWDELPGPPTPREHLGVATDDRVIYAVGGRIQGRLLGAFEALDPDSGQWAVLPGLPTPRGGLAATVMESRIVVAAGGESSNGTFSEVEIYVAALDRWDSLPGLPTPRHGLGVVADGDQLFVLAGGPQPGLTVSNANESLDLSGFAALELRDENELSQKLEFEETQERTLLPLRDESEKTRVFVRRESARLSRRDSTLSPGAQNNAHPVPALALDPALDPAGRDALFIIRSSSRLVTGCLSLG